MKLRELRIEKLENRLTLAGDSVVAHVLELGQTAAGTLEDGEVDAFAFPSVTATHYRIHFESDSILDPLFRMLNANGDPISALSPTLEEPGVYLLEATQNGCSFVGLRAEHVGDYTISISEIPDDFPDRYWADIPNVFDEIDSIVRGEIESRLDVDVVGFAADADATYRLAFNAITLEQASVRVFDPNGRSVRTSPFEGGLFFKTTDAGTYGVEMKPSGSPTRGTYEFSFQLSPDDHGDRSSSATPVELPGRLSGTFESSIDTDYLRFQARDGDTFKFTPVPGLGDPSGPFYQPDALDPAYRLGVHSDASGSLRDSFVESLYWRAKVSGQYYVRVVSDNPGRWAVDVESISDDAPDRFVPSAPRLIIGEKWAGTFEVDEDVDILRLEAAGNENYRFVFDAEEFHELEVFDETGNREFVRDEPGDLSGRLWYWRPGQSGVYYVKTSATTRAAYELTAELLPDDHPNQPSELAAVLEVGQSISGQLEGLTDADYFAFDAIAGQKYSLSVSDTVRYAIKNEADEFIFPRIPNVFQAMDSARYYVSVFGDRINEYDVSIGVITDDHGETKETATPFELGQVVRGLFEEAGDVDFFRTEVEEGGVYRISSTASRFGASFAGDVGFNPSLKQDGEILFKAPRSTVLFVSLAADRDERDYEFILEPVVDVLPDDHADSVGTEASPIIMGEPNVVRIEYAYDHDVFQMDASTGPKYQIELDPKSFFGKTASVTIVDANGQVLLETTPVGLLLPRNQPFYWDATSVSGVHYVIVKSTVPWEFDLTVTPIADDHADTPQLATPIDSFPASVDVNLFRDDTDMLTFEASANTYLVVDLYEEGRVSPLNNVILVDSQGVSYRGNSPVRTRKIWKVEEAGVYYFLASGQSSPTDRRLEIQALVDDHPDLASVPVQRVELRIPVHGQIDVEIDRDLFSLNVEANKIYRFETTGASPRTIATQLIDQQSSSRLVESLGGGFLWRSEQSGAVYVRLSSVVASDYELLVTQVDDFSDDVGSRPDNARKISEAAAVGFLDHTMDVDYYVFDTIPGVTYQLRYHPVAQAALTIVDAMGNPISRSWTAESDEYYVVVKRSTGNPRLGRYDFWVHTDARDLNGDGAFTSADVDLIVTHDEDLYDIRFDVTRDGFITQRDRDEYLSHVARIPLGDANLDLEVGFADFLLLSSRFGQPGSWANGDFDGNGQINFADFLLLSQNFGREI